MTGTRRAPGSSKLPSRMRSRTSSALLVASALLLAALTRDASSQDGPPPAEDERSAATPESRRAVERGLAWLVKNQEKDGSWKCAIGFKLNDNYKVIHREESHVGVSALAGTALLASGSVPGRGPYSKQVQRCVDYVISCQDPGTGFIGSNDTRMYSHAFATMFLAEVYGMTHDPKVRKALELAAQFTWKAQNSQGGWRYVPNADDSDMSITVCQVVALRAAKNKGIYVPKESVDLAVDYVLRSAVTTEGLRGNFERGAFLYQFASRNEQARTMTRTSFALTAAGLTTLYGAGVYTDADIAAFLRNRKLQLRRIPSFDEMKSYVLNHYPDVANGEYQHHYFYYYGNYYAAQAMYIAGEPWWGAYFSRARDDLVSKQRPDGAWPADNVGPAFTTAVATIVLQVPNCYLPIFQR